MSESLNPEVIPPEQRSFTDAHGVEYVSAPTIEGAAHSCEGCAFHADAVSCGMAARCFPEGVFGDDWIWVRKAK